MSFTKAHLCELFHELSKDHIKDYTKCKSLYKSKDTKGDLLTKVVESASVRKDELKNIILNNFSCLRFESIVYDYENDLSGLEYDDELSDLEGVSDTSFHDTQNILFGFKKVNLKVYADYIPGETDLDDFDEDDFDDKILYYPFIVKSIHNFLVIKVAYLVNGTRLNSYNGTKYYVNEHDYNISDFGDEIINSLNDTFDLEVGSRTNLVTGLCKLVKDGKLDAVRADCDDSANEGVNSRKLHKHSSKTFVDRDWYDNHDFYDTSIIYPTNWYFTNNSRTEKPETYPRLWIDSANGIMKKSKTTKESWDWYINELLNEN